MMLVGYSLFIFCRHLFLKKIIFSIPQTSSDEDKQKVGTTSQIKAPMQKKRGGAALKYSFN